MLFCGIWQVDGNRGRSGIDRINEDLGGMSWLIGWPRKKPVKKSNCRGKPRTSSLV